MRFNMGGKSSMNASYAPPNARRQDGTLIMVERRGIMAAGRISLDR
jgi:hypothetical protein